MQMSSASVFWQTVPARAHHGKASIGSTGAAMVSDEHSGKAEWTEHLNIRRLVLVPPYFVFCSISFRCGGLSTERNQKPLTPESTLAVTHHDKQKQVEVKRSSRANPHEIRLFSGCPYAVVKQGTKKFTKNKPYKGFSRFRIDLSLVGLTCALYVLFLIVIMLHGHPFCYAAD